MFLAEETSFYSLSVRDCNARNCSVALQFPKSQGNHNKITGGVPAILFRKSKDVVSEKMLVLLRIGDFSAMAGSSWDYEAKVRASANAHID